MTDTEALEAMLAHHGSLSEGVTRRVSAVRTAVEGAGRHEAAAGELVAYLADEVLPHATAEEHSIYVAAGRHPALEDVVASAIDEHRQLAETIEHLATARTGPDALAIAESVGSLFAAHVQKENELILPALVHEQTVSLLTLVAEMHRLTETGDRPLTAESAPYPDHATDLVMLLLDAADGLADAGRGDQACRLVAAAWATVQGPRPDLAVRLTGALHRLARTVTAEPVIFNPGSRSVAGNGTVATLDVRPLAPSQRHEKIFATFGALRSGAGFVLVNDHDPKPLRYQLEAEHPGEFTWAYLQEGPAVWRVQIGRAGSEGGR